MSSIYTLFNNKWMKALLAVVLGQQLLVASGTFLLGRMTAEFPTEGFQLGTAVLLLVCIVLPGTLGHYGVAWSLTRARKVTQNRFLQQYI